MFGFRYTGCLCYIYIYICIYVYINIYIYFLYTYMYVCLYIYIYIYIHLLICFFLCIYGFDWAYRAFSDSGFNRLYIYFYLSIYI